MNDIRETCFKLEERLVDIFSRETPPPRDQFLSLVKKTNAVLTQEDPSVRPCNSEGVPGGLVLLNRNIDTIIIPDIHGRVNLLLEILIKQGNNGFTNLQRFMNKELQIICLGDGMHAEGRAARRWSLASHEFRTEFAVHEAMDEEMRESFGVMEMVMELKCASPENFYFLKGNHENITNESGNGNHAFMKYSYEGAMVALYVQIFYGNEFIDEYYAFEKNLPLFAVGRNFLISHAEPAQYFSRQEIIEYRENPHVTEGLTWTGDGEADSLAVMEMIKEYIDPAFQEGAYYFGGHRPVKNLYNTRSEGKYVQVHNPDKFIIARINSIGDIDLERDIIEI